MRILLAEDDPVLRCLLEELLGRWGHESLSAEDGDAAVALSRAGERFDVAILDWMMPGTSGPEVCRAIRDLGGERRPYVLMLTAKSQLDDVVSGLDAGADEYLTKPYKPAELAARLRVAERIMKMQDDLIEARRLIAYQATHDLATGARNRATFLETVHRVLEERRAAPSPLSLIRVDVGGPAGGRRVRMDDEILKAIAGRVQSSVCPGALVGRTDYCITPPAVTAIPSVGGTKNPRVREILALSPDLVLANQEENTRGDLETIAQAGVRVLVAFPKRVAEGLAHLARLARILGVEDGARDLVKAGYAALREAEAKRSVTAPLRTVCPIWMDPLMTINGDTFISDMLDLAGAQNVFADRQRRYPLAADLGRAPPRPAEKVEGRDTRYPRVTMDEVDLRAPELVLLPDEPHPFSEEDAKVFLLRDTPAARRGAVVRTGGQDLCWYGSRSVDDVGDGAARGLGVEPHGALGGHVGADEARADGVSRGEYGERGRREHRVGVDREDGHRGHEVGHLSGPGPAVEDDDHAAGVQEGVEGAGAGPASAHGLERARGGVALVGDQQDVVRGDVERARDVRVEDGGRDGE